MKLFWLSITSIILGLFALPSPAHAQFEDLGGILEDILEGAKIPGPQTPIYGDNGIENIPVLIRYDMDTDLTDHNLIITAYAPNDPNGTKVDQKILGQTQLLLTGLSQPLQVSVAVPRNVTESLTHARITAEIKDENANQIMKAEHDGAYRGTEPPSITLTKTDVLANSPEQPNYIGFETVRGEINLSGQASLFRGGTLTIQLLENALAGGNSVTIAAEKIKSVDNVTPPFPFQLDPGLVAENAPPALTFKVWITDWAGRKTHVMRKPVHYTGPGTTYKITLDSLVQGADTRAGRNLNPALMAQAIVSGEAIFDANKGLPSDARLKVTLSRAVGAVGETRMLASQTIILNGFSGKARFAISTASTNFDPLIPAPLLNLQVIDRNDRIYFDSGDVSAKEGPQTIQLFPRSFY